MTPEAPDRVVRLAPDRLADVVDVLAESFHDYPVMRWVLGSATDGYDQRLLTLVGFFVMARVLRGETLLGVGDGAGLLGAAVVSWPSNPSPPTVAELRERVWGELGPDARDRYEAFAAACAPFQVETPHLHLNMIGVRSRARGLGLARRLIERVQAMSLSDPASSGVTLTTEDPSNVLLYEHLGYEVVGHATVSPELETWGFFRKDPSGGEEASPETP